MRVLLSLINFSIELSHETQDQLYSTPSTGFFVSPRNQIRWLRRTVQLSDPASESSWSNLASIPCGHLRTSRVPRIKLLWWDATCAITTSHWNLRIHQVIHENCLWEHVQILIVNLRLWAATNYFSFRISCLDWLTQCKEQRNVSATSLFWPNRQQWKTRIELTFRFELQARFWVAAFITSLYCTFTGETVIGDTYKTIVSMP